MILISCHGSKSDNHDSEISGDVIVFHAGSLSVPFHKAAMAFEEAYPGVDIKLEAAGSVACARKIIDLKRDCDIFASADYKVIDKLIVPKHADWNLKFAKNEITLIYKESSRYAGKISLENWHNIILRNNVHFGRSDPDSDPCGYRTVLCLKLAELQLQSIGLAGEILSKDQKHIRPKASDLIALLETGAIDYMFGYASVALQQGFKYLTLPDSVNLSNQALADWYKQVSVDIIGTRPGERISLRGEPILYGITLLKNSPNQNTAVRFLEFLLSSDKGLRIIQNNGQQIIDPPIQANIDKVPTNLKENLKIRQ